MRTPYSRVMARRIRLLGRAIPLWAAVGAAVALPAAAGQAVGPVLSGSITGSNPVAVGQAILLDTAVPFGKNPGFGNQNDILGEANDPSDGVTARSEDGTSFTVAMELYTGQRAAVNIYLANKSGADAAALLELSYPRGFSIGLADIDRPDEGGSNVNGTGGPIGSNVVREAQAGQASWLLTVGASAGTGNDDGVTLLVRPQPDISPGFYTITGRITQISGRLPAPAGVAATPTPAAARGPTALAATPPPDSTPAPAAIAVAGGTAAPTPPPAATAIATPAPTPTAAGKVSVAAALQAGAVGTPAAPTPTPGTR